MKITFWVILVTAIVSFFSFNRSANFFRFSFSPYRVLHSGEWYRIFSHALIHADWMHLLVNMYVLYQFGSVCEHFFELYFGNKGSMYFISLYVGGVVFATLPSIKKHKDNPNYSSVGASGAVSAVLFSSILFIPTESLRLFFIPIDIPAYLFGILYLIFEWYMDKKSTDRIAHDAHFVGAIFGIIFTSAVDYNILLSFLNQIIA